MSKVAPSMMRDIFNAVSLKVLIIFTIGSGLLSACRDDRIVSSGVLQSPNARWIASAETIQHSGPGTAGVQTVVYMEQAGGKGARTEVLLLDHDATEQGTNIGLKMRWISESHLDIRYSKAADIDFEAVRFAGADISVEKY